MDKIVEVNQAAIENHLGEMVRSTVEETLNAMLDAEADRLCNAERYEHTEARADTRAGHYERTLQTQAGEVKLRVPKLRKLPFETAIIERYRRRECSVEEALIEMYLAGVSVRRIEDITEALWGTRVSAGTVSHLNQKAYENIEKWRNLPITGSYAYVYADGIWLKRSWGGEIRNVSILVAIGVNGDGFRDILGVAEGSKEDKESWLGFLRHLRERGLGGAQLFITDRCIGLVEALSEVFPDSRWQRCVVHFYRNVFTAVPRGKMREVAAMLKAIHAQEDRKAAQEKAEQVCRKLVEQKLSQAAKIVEEGVAETLQYMSFPREHWKHLRTNNVLERLMREIRRRTRAVGSFPDGHSALMLAAARLRHVAGTKWSSKRLVNMDALKDMQLEGASQAA
jgi:putative transposase